MSLVGMGRAFNLRFMPNGPLRTNCYHRPMPHIGFFGGGGGNMSYTENINIQNGPTGFWGFMTGLTQGLFGGGMFGCGMGGGLFGLLNSQKATPQGTDQAQGGEDKHLKNLQQAYGKKYEIVSHPDKKGIYQAFPKGGGKPIEGTYDDLCTKLAEEGDETPTVAPKKKPEKTEAQLKEEKAKEHGLELKDGKYMKNGKEYVWDPTINDFKLKENDSSVDDGRVRVKPEELANGANITVIDEVWDAAHPGHDGHIKGTTKLSGKKNDEGFDKQITVGGKRYALQDKKVDGDPVYKSLDGDGDTYRLSKKDGKLVLIQSESDKGKLSGVGTTDIHRTTNTRTGRHVTPQGAHTGRDDGTSVQRPPSRFYTPPIDY